MFIQKVKSDKNKTKPLRTEISDHGHQSFTDFTKIKKIF